MAQLEPAEAGSLSWWPEVSRIESVEQAGNPLSKFAIVGHRNDSLSEPARVTPTSSRQHKRLAAALPT